MTEPTDTNQASEDELRKGIIGELSRVQLYAKDHPYSVTATDESDIEKAADAIQSLIRTEKLKLLDKFENDCKYNYTTFGNSEKMLQVSGLLKRIEAERTKLEAEL